MSSIREPARQTPVVDECDVCVVGGSCTGLFAAIRAAQQGARVVLVENNGYLGGMATAGLVAIWHSPSDTVGRKRILAGLTEETVDRLATRKAVMVNPNPSHDWGYRLNPWELAVELDAMADEAGVKVRLNTRFVDVAMRDGRAEAVIIEDKSGRRAITARTFIDATGDGDLLARAGLGTRLLDDLQPPTMVCWLGGLAKVREANRDFDLSESVHDPSHPKALKQGFLWGTQLPGLDDLYMVAGTRAHGANCADADQLTAACIETRRQCRAIRDIVSDLPGGEDVALAALGHMIGIRETRHAECLHTLTEQEVLTGKRFPDAIANGSYRVDVHHSERSGLTFRYLDGTETYVEPGQPRRVGRWRDPLPDGQGDPTFYQIPYRSLVPRGGRNVLTAGRLVDADRGAFGAIRVMVNCNQTGEAAGVAAALAADRDCDVADVNIDQVRRILSERGAIIF
ncbi:MAG: FAD-dependent oxidoreductase [Planctomycetota bacterium]